MPYPRLLFPLRLRRIMPACGILAGTTFGADLATTESLITQWAQLRTEAGRIESDWHWQRNVLQTTQEALQHQIARLEAERELQRATQGKVNQERAVRAAETAAQQQTLDAIDRELRTLAARAVALQRWLPPRLAAAVELPARSLADPALPAADRMQHLATFQNRCNQFNRVVTFSEEVLVLPDHDRPRLLEILYWGLAAAYALDRERNLAYTGYPGPEGWVWEPLPEAAEDVAQLLAVHRDEQAPMFVNLPLQVRDLPRDRMEAVR